MSRLTWVLVDLACVVLFAGLGRASHGEHVVSGLAHTAWPFLLACVVGWILAVVVHRDAASVAGGFIVWPVTALAGLSLRLISGTSARWSFWIVATGVLCLFLMGWRVLRTVLIARSARHRVAG